MPAIRKYDSDGRLVEIYEKNEDGSFPPPKPEPAQDSINLDNLMESYMLILHRETEKLLSCSKGNQKLTKDLSEEMRQNMKLVMELKKKEQELLSNLSDEDIKKMIEAKINETS